MRSTYCQDPQQVENSCANYEQACGNQQSLMLQLMPANEPALQIINMDTKPLANMKCITKTLCPK